MVLKNSSVGIPPKEDVIKAGKPNVWDAGNKVLYDLCANNFTHDNKSNIISKVWLIGRAYAAAIERRKDNRDIDNDTFYTTLVVKAFQESKIDDHLSRLNKYESITTDNIALILEAHNILVKSIAKITGNKKRSLVSKYLHFHLPELFFIYDSRAVNALRQYIKRVPDELKHLIKKK